MKAKLGGGNTKLHVECNTSAKFLMQANTGKSISLSKVFLELTGFV